MSIEQMAVDAAFASDIARDADYYKAPGPAVKVRVIATSPDYRRDVGSIAVQGQQRLIDVRVSEVPTPAQGDTVTPYIETSPGVWAPGAEVLQVTKRPDRSDRCALVWTLDLVKI
nr:hypothetical protein [uncultured Dongia sp.]